MFIKSFSIRSFPSVINPTSFILDSDNLSSLFSRSSGDFSSVDHRIVNGRSAIIGGNRTKFPWQAVLLNKKNKEEIVCGATLVSHRHLLLAAHCFDSFTFEQLDVVLGAAELSSVKAANKLKSSSQSGGGGGGLVTSITRAAVHSDYGKRVPNDYDFAIATLKDKVHIACICVNT